MMVSASILLVNSEAEPDAQRTKLTFTDMRGIMLKKLSLLLNKGPSSLILSLRSIGKQMKL